MSDELESLTDAQLSEVFAVEVAGWSKRLGSTHPENDTDDDVLCWYGPTRENQNAAEKRYGYVTPPSFAMSADAVLPFLEKERAWTKGTVGMAVTVWSNMLSPAYPHKDYPNDPPEAWMILKPVGHYWDPKIQSEEDGKSQVPFARAACISLIRAKRSTDK